MMASNKGYSPTTHQRKLIKQIKVYLGKEFKGTNSWEAFQFIQDNLHDLSNAMVEAWSKNHEDVDESLYNSTEIIDY